MIVDISQMKKRHLGAVMRIETKLYPHPWSMNVFLTELLRYDRIYRVARVGKLVVGYSGLMIIDDVAHVANIAVDPIWQHRGIATQLMLHNVRTVLDQGLDAMTLEVRATGFPAQGLYRKFGFVREGVRKNYYERSEDALIMWATDINSEEYLQRLSAIEAQVSSTTTIAEVV